MVDKSRRGVILVFEGVIIEESLEKKDILKRVKILDTKIENVTPDHQQELSLSLDSKHSWYADFKNENFHYIIFRNKIFKVDRAKPKQYGAVTKCGLTLGIPDYQLDFSPDIKEWKR